MMRHLRLTTLVALFVVISAVAAAAAPFAYITQSTGGIFVLDTGTTPPSASTAVTFAVPAGPPFRSPWGGALSPDGGTLYVANFAFTGGSVMAFNTSTGALIREVALGMLPFGVAVNPVSGEIYVSVAVGNGPLGPGAKLVAINPSTFVNLGAPPVLAWMSMPSPRGVAVNKAGTAIYVTSFANNLLFVFNGAANANGTHDLITTIQVGTNPVGVAVSPDGSTVYVTNQGSDEVTMVNAADYNTKSIFDGIGDGPTGVAVSPDGLEVYVANQGSVTVAGTVSVLDAAGSKIGDQILVGTGAYGIGTDGVYVYVAVFGSNKITVIDRVSRAKTDITAASPVGLGIFVLPAMKIATVMSLTLSSNAVILESTTPITATATLQRKNNGAPVAGATIEFSGASGGGTAVTGETGVAQWSFNASALGIGTYAVKAVFTESKIGSNVYLGSEASASFSVRYAFVWLRPSSGSTTGVNAGSTVPVNFSVMNANGVAITYPGAVAGISSAPCAGSSSAKSASVQANSAGNSGLRYNGAHFDFNWKTDKAWAGSCRQLIVSLSDGSSHSLTFQFR